MSIPFPHPQNANEARGNMLYWADEAEKVAVAGHIIGPGIAAVEKAKMWAAIALTLPEAPTYAVLGDDRTIHEYMPVLEPWPNQPGADDPPLEKRTGVVIPSGVQSGTIAVDSLGWDVLRVLATRYVLASLDRSATVDLTEPEFVNPAWELHFEHHEFSTVVKAVIEPTP